MDFEWDERKRLSNLDKHGLDFIDVIDVFEAPYVIVPSKQKSRGEKRLLATGKFHNRHVTIVFTERNGKIRIISFRRARHEEKQTYQDLYGG